MFDGLLGGHHEQVGVALGQDHRIEARRRRVGDQLGVVEEGELVGDGGEVGAAFLLADLGLALDRDAAESAREGLLLPEGRRKALPRLRRRRQHLVQRLERALLRRLLEAHPRHVAGDDGAGGFVEMPAVFVSAGTGRCEQRVEQHVDVAHGEALVLADERQRVVGRGPHVRQMARREPFPVALRHAEGVEEQHAAAELAARVYGDRGPVETTISGREQIEGDDGALARARRGHGDGGAFERPADVSHGREAGVCEGQGSIRQAQVDVRGTERLGQGGAGVPTVQPAGLGQGAGRMAPGVPCAEHQASGGDGRVMRAVGRAVASGSAWRGCVMTRRVRTIRLRGFRLSAPASGPGDKPRPRVRPDRPTPPRP